MTSLLKWYKHVNHTYPMRTNLIQTGVLFGLGDLNAQCLVERRKPADIDWLRTVRYVSVGCALGPTLTLWYKTMNRIGTENTFPIVAKKLFVDQFVANPFLTGVVMIMSRVWSGDEWPQIQKKLEDNYFTVLLNSYLVWPAVQAVNFTLVPIQYRVVSIQIVALAWNTYLSCMTVGGDAPKES